MDQQQKLFRLAVESGHVIFNHEPGRGWRLQMAFRRGAELWSETDAEVYEGLTTVELITTIEAGLDSAL